MRFNDCCGLPASSSLVPLSRPDRGCSRVTGNQN
jgi:hypothetical protein